MTFRRLMRADWVAMIAALALLLVMAADWYGTESGERARRIQEQTDPRGGEAGQPAREIEEDARVIGENSEKNAWQVDGAIDRLILVALIATILAAIAAAFMRAAGRRFEEWWSPSGIAALSATITAVLVLYRMAQEPGYDNLTTVKSAPPLAIVVLGVIALASATALRAEETGRAWRAVAAEDGAPSVESPAR